MIIVALAVIVPAFFSARQGMVLFLRSSARPGKPILQRYYIDLGIVALAALGLWELNQKGSVFDARSVGGWSADPLLLASPLLLIVAVGVLMFRFLPPLLSVISRIVSVTAGAGLTLGFWQLTRSPARYTQLALLVVMAAAVGTFAATYGETTDRSQEQQALYAVGADMRITNLGRLDKTSSAEISKGLEDDTARRGGRCGVSRQARAGAAAQLRRDVPGARRRPGEGALAALVPRRLLRRAAGAAAAPHQRLVLGRLRPAAALRPGLRLGLGLALCSPAPARRCGCAPAMPTASSACTSSASSTTTVATGSCARRSPPSRRGSSSR